MSGFGAVRCMVLARRVAPMVSLVVSLVVLATLLEAPPPARAAAPGDQDQAPAVPAARSVPGRPVPALPRVKETAAPRRALPAPSWPAAGTAEVTLPAVAGGGVAAPALVPATGLGLPVRVGAAADAAARPAGGTAAAPDAPGRVRVSVLPGEAAGRLGVDGSLLRVDRADGVARPGRVRLEVDYSGFAGAFGGDWSSRLHLTRLPRCALTTPDRAGCRLGAPLASVNDPAAGTVSADVTLDGTGDVTLDGTVDGTGDVTLDGTVDGTGSLSVGTQGAVLALTASPNGPSGDYTATSLSPSATWDAGDPSGDFTWSYPVRVPPAPGGPEPSLAVAYASGSVDGRTASTNAQTSWVGEGFELWPGFIERSYKPCADDGHAGKGDLCWAYANTTMFLNGSATELVRDDASGVWRPQQDDGSRIQLTSGAANGDDNGERWVVTTKDGTQYHFGLHRLPGWASGMPQTDSVLTVPVFGDDAGEPCHGATFAASWCQQAYRWNLDYVVDPHGNAMSVFYARETNHYGRNLTGTDETAYHRAAVIERIDYGQRAESLFTVPATARVTFASAERCLPAGGFSCDPALFNEANASHWPDTPVDLDCAAGSDCGDNVAPSFWSRKRLTGITTQVRNPGTATYRNVESWTLEHEFPEAGDGMTPALWLTSITHTGLAGTQVTLPKTTFISVQLPNRVQDWDALPALFRRRVAAIESETGGDLSIDYAPTECTASTVPQPASNAKRCFPQKWTMVGVGEQDDWFHKHVVSRVVAMDTVAGSPWMETRYEYLGGAAWHYDDDDGLTPEKEKSWSQWRGYARVRVGGGAGLDPRTLTERRFFRGMHGDRADGGGTKSVAVTDSEGTSFTDGAQYAGMPLESITYNGPSGPVVTATVAEPWSHGPTATRVRTWGTTRAYLVGTGAIRTRVALESGGWRRTRSTTTFETTYGRPVRVDDAGDTATTADDLCTFTTYAAPNTAAHLVDHAARVETVSAACGATISRPGDVVSDLRTYYDGLAFGAAPTRGDETRVERVRSYSGTTPDYQVVSTATFDLHGRQTRETDALGGAVTTAFTPATGGPLTRTVVTGPDPDGAGSLTAHVTTTDLDPAWGLPVTVADPNGKVTSQEHDALGRLAKVWRPDRSKQAGQSPNYQFEYLVRDTAPTVVTTRTIQNDQTYRAAYGLYDGFLRQRQTQAPSPVGGRIVSDTLHDSLGRVAKANQAYWNASAPGTSLLGVVDTDVAGQAVTAYDGAGRVVASIFQIRGDERWRTTTSHGGDRVHTDPPDGGTPTTVVTDARGRTTALTQWESATPRTGTARTTTYGYDHAGRLERVTDPAGNRWTYAYDLRGRQTSATDPDRGTTSSAYDDLDQLLTSTDARSVTLAYAYDTLGRKTELREGSATGTLRAKWAWDLAAKGVLAKTFRYVGADAYTVTTNLVDNLYRPKRQTWTIPASVTGLAGSYQLNTAYNLDDTVLSTSLPAAGGLPEESLARAYGPVSTPTALTGLSSYVTGTLYTPAGEPQRIDLWTGGAGKKAWISYGWEDGTRRLAQLMLTREGVTGPDQDAHFGYDPAGNLTRIADRPGYGRPDDVQCFAYDPLRRLTGAWTATDDCAAAPSSAVIGGAAPYWTSYAYDAAGNRTGETRHGLAGAADTVRAYAYPVAGGPRPHALGQVTTTMPGVPTTTDTFAYDQAGDTVGRALAGQPGQALTWDPEGHLATVTQAGQTTSFVYDADGGRLLRADPTGTTLYLPGMEVRRAGATGAVSATRYYAHAGRTVAVRTTAGVSFLAADHHGTAELAVDATTGALARRRFDPFGNPRGAAPSWPGERGFVGGTLDAVTGLTHLGAREYEPATGRFISVDPLMDLTDPQQWHGYAYANANPATWSDPTGLILDGGNGITMVPKKKKAKRPSPKRVKKRGKRGGIWGWAAALRAAASAVRKAAARRAAAAARCGARCAGQRSGGKAPPPAHCATALCARSYRGGGPRGGAQDYGGLLGGGWRDHGGSPSTDIMSQLGHCLAYDEDGNLDPVENGICVEPPITGCDEVIAQLNDNSSLTKGNDREWNNLTLGCGGLSMDLLGPCTLNLSTSGSGLGVDALEEEQRWQRLGVVGPDDDTDLLRRALIKTLGEAAARALEEVIASALEGGDAGDDDLAVTDFF